MDKIIGIMLGCLLLVGCAGLGGEREETLEQHLERLGYRQGGTVESIQRQDISGWEYLDQQHISLGGGPGRRYLVEFRRPCRNLGFGNTLAYSTTLGELTRLDRIVSVDVGGFPEHCPIAAIYRLERIDPR